MKILKAYLFICLIFWQITLPYVCSRQDFKYEDPYVLGLACLIVSIIPLINILFVVSVLLDHHNDN